MEKIILFDGVCNFCNQSVQFIMKRDPKAQFKFVSQHSELGKKLLENDHNNRHTDSLVLIENDRTYHQSTAALRICKRLKGIWKLLYVFIIIPAPIRDFFYQIIAKNRYKWFGKSESCRLLTNEERQRFLDT